MMRPIENFIFESLILHHDEYDGICYIKYLSECRTMNGETILWVGANTHESEVVFFVTNDDDTSQRFECISCVSETMRHKIIYQINPIVRQIVYRSMKKKNREDLPCGFYTKAIHEYMSETDLDTQKTYSGEVGMSGSTDDPFMAYVSVYYPNKINPSYSYDTELYFLSQDELKNVLKSLSEKNNLHKKLEVEQSTFFSMPIAFTEVLSGSSVDETRKINFQNAKKNIAKFFKSHSKELMELGIEVKTDALGDYFIEHIESILTKDATDEEIKKFYEN